MNNTDNRFLLQESERLNFYTLTDTENQIVCTFEKGKFNDTQKYTSLNDDTNIDAMQLARICREMADYLFENHYSIIF